MWAQVINTMLGVWLMAAPGALRYFGAARDNDHIVGPLIGTFACVAIWQCTRAVRWWNVPLGAWLIVAPWVLRYDAPPAIVNDMVVGAVVIALSCVRGRLDKRFGGGWSALWKRTSPTSL